MEKNSYNPIEQRKTKPKIDDILPIYLGDSTLEKAMEFVAFLRESKMNPGWRSPNSWCASCKGKVVVYIKIVMPHMQIRGLILGKLYFSTILIMKTRYCLMNKLN